MTAGEWIWLLIGGLAGIATLAAGWLNLTSAGNVPAVRRHGVGRPVMVGIHAGVVVGFLVLMAGVYWSIHAGRLIWDPVAVFGVGGVCSCLGSWLTYLEGRQGGHRRV